MDVPHAVTERMRRAAAVGSAKSMHVDKELVHKHDERNVFLARLERWSGEEPDIFLAEMIVDPTHPYHFEHPLDHVPGMMLMEAGRQMAIAVTHRFYDVPQGAVFVLNHMEAQFGRFAELSEPSFLRFEVHEKKFLRERMISMRSTAEFIQNNESLGSMGGSWTICDPRVIQRARRMALRTGRREQPGNIPTVGISK